MKTWKEPQHSHSLPVSKIFIPFFAGCRCQQAPGIEEVSKPWIIVCPISKDSSEKAHGKAHFSEFSVCCSSHVSANELPQPQNRARHCFISVKWDVRAAFWHLHLQTDGEVLITEGNQLRLGLQLAVHLNL